MKTKLIELSMILAIAGSLWAVIALTILPFVRSVAERLAGVLQ